MNWFSLLPAKDVVTYQPLLLVFRVGYIKRLIRGDHQPKGFMDLYYDKDDLDASLPMEPSLGRTNNQTIPTRVPKGGDTGPSRAGAWVGER